MDRRITATATGETPDPHWPPVGQIFVLVAGPKQIRMVYLGDSEKKPGCYVLTYEAEGRLHEVHLPPGAVTTE